MSYKENEVVAKFTKGNHQSDCKKYTADDLLEMFDQTNVTKNELGDYEDFTVNECITHVDLDSVALVTKDLVVTSECDDMFVYLNNDNIEVECSLELDYEFANESI